MPNIFSVETIAFTVLGYPLSYIELVGTVLYLLSVWLIARRNILTWPVGIASVILYLLLFYQIRLYADTAEQVYYLFASIYGWWMWSRSPKERRTEQGQSNVVSGVRYSRLSTVLILIAVTGIVTALTTQFLMQAHILIPAVFVAPAAYPFLDALTTVMSFIAMALLTLKRVESWIYWIIVDVIAVYLYWVQGVRFITLLYVVLLVIAVRGFVIWHRAATRSPVPANADSPALPTPAR